MWVGISVRVRGRARASTPVYFDRLFLSAVGHGDHDPDPDRGEQPDSEPERRDRGEDAGFPEGEQRHRQLAGDGNDGAFLRGPAAARCAQSILNELSCEPLERVGSVKS